jgi:hypothetical protein
VAAAAAAAAVAAAAAARRRRGAVGAPRAAPSNGGGLATESIARELGALQFCGRVAAGRRKRLSISNSLRSSPVQGNRSAM